MFLYRSDCNYAGRIRIQKNRTEKTQIKSCGEEPRRTSQEQIRSLCVKQGQIVFAAMHYRGVQVFSYVLFT
jgi:hypothetical protein